MITCEKFHPGRAESLFYQDPRSSNSPFTKGGWGVDFLKFGNKGGDKIFFLEREDCLGKGEGVLHFYIKFS